MKKSIKSYLAVFTALSCAALTGCGEEAANGKESEKTVQSEIVSQVSFGSNTAAVVTESKKLYLWGNDEYHKLSVIANNQPSDNKIPSDTWNTNLWGNILKVSVGDDHVAVIDENNVLYVWGSSDEGKIGDGEDGGWDGDGTSSKTQILENVIDVSAGHCSTAAVTADNSLYIWGDANSSCVPVKIMDNVVDVECGDYHYAAITEDGTLYMWGRNYEGELGDGTREGSDVPIIIMEDVKQVSLGYGSTAILKNSGELYVCGNNISGQLGTGKSGGKSNWFDKGIDLDTPEKIMENVKMVNMGCDHGAAITEDGALYIWGANKSGALGNGSTEDSAVPVKIMDNIAEVSLGMCCSAAIDEQGNLYTWGENDSGQLGDGTTENCLTPKKIVVD